MKASAQYAFLDTVVIWSAKYQINESLHTQIKEHEVYSMSMLLKGRQMGHYVMVSLWCESLSTNDRRCVLY